MPFTVLTCPRAVVAALVVAVLTAACSSVSLERRYEPPPVRMPQALPPPAVAMPQPVPQDGQQAHLVTLTTRLEGAAVSPPVRSAGKGQFDAMYDTTTRLLRWKTTWSGLTGPITDVRFHGPADRGQNGPPAILWPAPFGPTYEGRATLTPQQAQDLLQGRWYLNVSTTMYPSGELRGQLRVVP
jgi:hypothetical protein